MGTTRPVRSHCSPPTPPDPVAVIGTAGRSPISVLKEISVLREYAQQRQLPVPGYTYPVDGPGHAPTFTAAAGQRSAQWAGSTNNVAKTRAVASLPARLSGAGLGGGASTGPVWAEVSADVQHK